MVEYRQPAYIESMPTLFIDQVVQGYRLLSGWPHGEEVDRGPFGNSGACNINVNCPEGATWATEKRSVALIVQGGFAACTGGMVNNTANDGTPYFLTANHCLGNPGNWVYRIIDCDESGKRQALCQQMVEIVRDLLERLDALGGDLAPGVLGSVAVAGG